MCAEVAHSSSVRRRRRSADEEAVRIARALSVAGIWESCQFGDVTDPTRRPFVARRVLSLEVLNAQPAVDPLEFLICLWKSRRGASRSVWGVSQR